MHCCSPTDFCVCVQNSSSVDGETPNDKLQMMSQRGGGKVSGRAAKQRAIARGDNLAPAQVATLEMSCTMLRQLEGVQGH